MEDAYHSLVERVLQQAVVQYGSSVPTVDFVGRVVAFALVLVLPTVETVVVSLLALVLQLLGAAD